MLGSAVDTAITSRRYSKVTNQGERFYEPSLTKVHEVNASARLDRTTAPRIRKARRYHEVTGSKPGTIDK